VVRIPGIAFGWIGSTTAFGDVVKQRLSSLSYARQCQPRQRNDYRFVPSTTPPGSSLSQR
jgi:hypothetical protein